MLLRVDTDRSWDRNSFVMSWGKFMVAGLKIPNPGRANRSKTGSFQISTGKFRKTLNAVPDWIELIKPQ